MEKDGVFGNFNWQPDSHNISAAAAAAIAEMNNNNISNNSGSCDNENGNGADQSSVLAATSSFLNLNWDQSSTDQTANFESALSSLVSSPSSSNPNPTVHAASADSLVIRELIGRLGSICNNNNNNNSSDVSPSKSSHYQSTNNSCYSTPLNSPPKLNLLSMMDHHPQFQLARAAAATAGGSSSMGNNYNNTHRPIPFAADPGFAERAARFSCLGSATARNYAKFSIQESGKLSRVSSSQSLKGMTASNNGVGVNVNHPNPIHLQQLDGMGSGIGGQLENDMVVMMMMMRSGEEFASNNAQEESSASDQMPPNVVNMNVNEGYVRKRKATTPTSNKGGSSSSSGGGRGRGTPNSNPNPNPNPKGGEEENSNSKRSKSAAAEAEAGGAGKDRAVKTPKAEQNSTSIESAQKQGKDKNKNKDNDKDMDNNVKPPEPPKQDYIHVRARRGQATDSHSLAERVRREKISERMKFLQDLVPGCNKVTGKAVMLDEIINYVQSLQRQVEFLSMKLATVNPRLDINVDSLLTKDVHNPRRPMMAPQSSYPLEATSNGFSYANQQQGQNHLQSLIASNGLETQCSVNNPLEASSLLRRSLGMQLPSLEGFTDAAASQLGTFWEDDLQSVVQMGFGQNQEAIFSSHNFQGPLPTSHKKIEL